MVLSKQETKKIYEEYLSTNKSLTNLAKEYNTSRQYLVKKFKQYCGYVSAIKKPTKHKQLVTDEIVDKYYEEFTLTNKSQSKFAKENGICRQVLSDKFKAKYPYIKTLRLEPNKKNINSEAFSIINEDSAYWLGMMLTDGYVSKDYKKFELTLKDKEHIEKFKSFLQSDHKISKRTIVINNKECISWRISIKDDNICKDLKNLGCCNNKSFNVRIPKIDKKYHKDLIRGILDGDGYIGQKTAGFCSGNKDFIQDIIDVLEEHDISCGKITHSRNLYSVRIRTANNNAKNFFSFIYDNSNELNRLDRKYNKYLEIAALG